MANRSPSSGRTTVLIADDEPVVRKMLAAVLAQAGHQVLLAADGVDALALAFRDEIGVILLDLQMPGLSGESFCRQYRASRGTAPIILMTATVGAPLEEIIARCRPDAVLIKPFRLSEMRQRVQQQLELTETLNPPDPR